MGKVNSETLKVAISLTKGIEELGLSTTSYNSLRRWGISTIADVCEACMGNKIKMIRGIGEKSIAEINYALERYFAKHGMEMDNEN